MTDDATRDSGITAWEAAYERFETPPQERAKFAKRLKTLGVPTWSRDLRIVEVFCGRGNGLAAWSELGFTRLEGLDISPRLTARYEGPARIIVGDARSLPFDSVSRDVVAVQGGLHHLTLMDDLHRVLEEFHRVLVPGGRALIVEPWLTPFLRLVHGGCGVRTLRRTWPRLEALQTMIEHERETYEDWLDRPVEILNTLRRFFEPQTLRIGWGKLMLVGQRREG